MDIYDDADPHDWAETYNGVVVTENPMYRLYTAASANGYGTAHLNQWDNGVDHW